MPSHAENKPCCADCDCIVYPSQDARGKVFAGFAQCSLAITPEQKAMYFCPRWQACHRFRRASDSKRIEAWAASIFDTSGRAWRAKALAECPDDLREKVRERVIYLWSQRSDAGEL